MKRWIPVFIFSLLSIHSCAQEGMFGIQAGLGETTSYKSYFTPSFEGYYLAKASPHIYVGGALTVQRYSFLYDLDKGGSPAYGDVLSIRQKSSYIFFSPKIDLGIGYHKYVHFNFSFGPGIFLGGNKTTDNYEPIVSNTGAHSGGDTVTFNSFTMRYVLIRYTFGVEERIPTHGYWNITLSQEFSYLPGKLNYPGTDLVTNYILFSIGIMHKFPLVAVEY